MTKKELKKLKIGKKIYIVEKDDYCECPMCDGSCNEAEMYDTKVEHIDLETGKIYARLIQDEEYCLVSFHIPSWHYKNVFTRKRDAEKRFKELGGTVW